MERQNGHGIAGENEVLARGVDVGGDVFVAEHDGLWGAGRSARIKIGANRLRVNLHALEMVGERLSFLDQRWKILEPQRLYGVRQTGNERIVLRANDATRVAKRHHRDDFFRSGVLVDGRGDVACQNQGEKGDDIRVAIAPDQRDRLPVDLLVEQPVGQSADVLPQFQSCFGVKHLVFRPAEGGRLRMDPGLLVDQVFQIVDFL